MKHLGFLVLFGTAFLVIADCVSTNTVVAQSDVIRLKSGGRSPRGRITRISEKTIVIEENGGPRTVDVYEIDTVEFGGEPRELDRARDEYNQQRYNACMEQLDQLDASTLNDYMKADVAFYKMAAAAQSSFAGGAMTATDAAQFAAAYLSEYPNDWHHYRACGIMADLAMEAGRFDSAADNYAKVIESAWPTFTAPANQKLGEAYIRLENFDQAESSLKAVLSTNSNEDVVQAAKLKAQCLQAVVVAKKGNPNAAISALQKLIKENDSNNKDLFATAYNSLGNCHLAANQQKEALFAFLHTDLLYQTEHRQHAEALYHLSNLWKEINKTDRANRAAQTLKQRYRNSHWANK